MMTTWLYLRAAEWCRCRPTAQIDRIKLNRSNVEELPAQIRGYLRNDL